VEKYNVHLRRGCASARRADVHPRRGCASARRADVHPRRGCASARRADVRFEYYILEASKDVIIDEVKLFIYKKLIILFDNI